MMSVSKITKTFSVDSELYEKFEKLSKKINLNKSSFIEKKIREYVNESIDVDTENDYYYSFKGEDSEYVRIIKKELNEDKELYVILSDGNKIKFDDFEKMCVRGVRPINPNEFFNSSCSQIKNDFLNNVSEIKLVEEDEENDRLLNEVLCKKEIVPENFLDQPLGGIDPKYVMNAFENVLLKNDINDTDKFESKIIKASFSVNAGNSYKYHFSGNHTYLNETGKIDHIYYNLINLTITSKNIPGKLEFEIIVFDDNKYKIFQNISYSKINFNSLNYKPLINLSIIEDKYDNILTIENLNPQYNKFEDVPKNKNLEYDFDFDVKLELKNMKVEYYNELKEDNDDKFKYNIGDEVKCNSNYLIYPYQNSSFVLGEKVKIYDRYYYHKDNLLLYNISDNYPLWITAISLENSLYGTEVNIKKETDITTETKINTDIDYQLKNKTHRDVINMWEPIIKKFGITENFELACLYAHNHSLIEKKKDERDLSIGGPNDSSTLPIALNIYKNVFLRPDQQIFIVDEQMSSNHFTKEREVVVILDKVYSNDNESITDKMKSLLKEQEFKSVEQLLIEKTAGDITKMLMNPEVKKLYIYTLADTLKIDKIENITTAKLTYKIDIK